LSSWLGFLRAGGTRRAVVDGIWNSAEHRSRQITALYQTIIGTTPDAGALNYYVSVFRSGASEFDVAALIASSPQATNLYPTTAAYVTKLYDVALGRTPSPTELNAWTTFQTDRTTIAKLIFLSDESLSGVIQRSFLQVLGRPASQPEVASRLAQLRPGTTLSYAGFIEDLLTSPEYAARMGA